MTISMRELQKKLRQLLVDSALAQKKLESIVNDLDKNLMVEAEQRLSFLLRLGEFTIDQLGLQLSAIIIQSQASILRDQELQSIIKTLEPTA